MCATSEIFKPLPEVNNQPLVENSPYLVTLVGTQNRLLSFSFRKSITQTLD
jgi:hypothetical protein